jgi:predicted DNA-binding ribbon-helix-helix protein
LATPGVDPDSIGSRQEGVMKSCVVKRSIVIGGHKTSVSLEDGFWNGVKEISGLREMTLSELVSEIDHNRQQGNLSSAIRLFVLDHYKNSACGNRTALTSVSKPTEEQHERHTAGS